MIIQAGSLKWRYLQYWLCLRNLVNNTRNFDCIIDATLACIYPYRKAERVAHVEHTPGQSAGALMAVMLIERLRRYHARPAHKGKHASSLTDRQHR